MSSVRSALLVPLLAPAFLASCGTVAIRVPVLVPAPVNLVQYDRIAVDRFQGEGCAAFSEQLAAALRAAVNPLTGAVAFDVLHRRDIDAALDQLRARRGEEWDQRTMEILDQWRTAQVALSGTVQVHEVHAQLVEEEVATRDGQKHVELVRRCAAEVRVQLEVTDLDGNTVFDRADLVGLAKGESRSREGEPAAVAPEPLLASARAAIVRDYLARVLPHQVWVRVTLYADDDVPDLQIGNGYAEAGNWPEAISSYLRALEAMTGELAGIRHKGLCNLGIAYMFSDRFAEARQALQEAYALGRDAMILDELRRVDRREQEVQRLREQGGPAAAPDR